MDQLTVTKLQELTLQGEKLTPEGGHEFSGYNAKLQSQYLMWRKSCLDTIAKLGVTANPLREKITKDENGAYFYQNSAQLILDTVKQALTLAESEMKKSAPAPAAAPAPAPVVPKPAPAPPPAPAPKPEPVAPRPATAPAPSAPKPAPAQAAAPAPVLQNGNASSKTQVLVLSSSESEFQNHLTALLKEIGIEGIVFQRGTAADAIVGFLEQYPTVRYAYYLYNPEDINSAMFELGYLIGKVGSNRVCCIHHKDETPPKGIPGISYKEVVVKLEEISFSLIKDLKAAGYTVTL